MSCGPELLHHFRGHKDGVTAVDMNPRVKEVVSASRDGTIVVWNWNQEKKAYKFSGHTGPCLDVRFSRSGHLMASASADRTLRLWQPNNQLGDSVALTGHSGPVNCLDFSPDNLRIASGADDKTVRLWTISQARLTGSLGQHDPGSQHQDRVLSVQFAPSASSSLVASCSADRSVKLWDERSTRCVASLPPDEDGTMPRHLSFHPTGTCLAVASGDRVKVLDVTGGMRLRQLYLAHVGQVNQVSFHPSGNYLLSAGHDGTVKLYDCLKEARPLYTVRGHEGAVAAVAFSPNGGFFCTGGEDSQVMMWRREAVGGGSSTREVLAQINR